LIIAPVCVGAVEEDVGEIEGLDAGVVVNPFEFGELVKTCELVETKLELEVGACGELLLDTTDIPDQLETAAVPFLT